MAQVSFTAWQNFLKDHPQAHLLQTAEWGELKAAFGWQVARIISGGQGLQILFRKLPLGFTVAYAPKPILDGGLQTLNPALKAEIDTICRQHRAVFLKIEPDAWEPTPNLAEQPGWSLTRSPHNIQPPRTVLVSLAGSLDDILGRMKQKCRYNIRLAEKKEVTVRAWDDPAGFQRLMLVTGERDGFGVHSQAYYQKAYELFHPAGMAELLLAEFESQPLAALMVFARGARSWYLYGASNDAERNRMPAYLLQWRAMQWAKERGCTEYDLWGVPDEDEAQLEAQFEQRQDGLWGVYRFKRGFGGQVQRAAQALDRIYIPLVYRLYLRRLNIQQ